MADRLRIQREGHPDAEVPLPPGLLQVGRNSACQIVIDHPEVFDQVATLECRGGVYFVQNLCPYDIFVGRQSCPPRTWGPWQTGETLRLSKSVSLELVADGAAPGAIAKPGGTTSGAEGSPAQDSEGRRKMIQLGVTLGCLALGGLLLTNGGSTSTPAVQVTFEELLAELNQTQPRNEILRDLLQSAWTIDLRVRKHGDRNDAIRAYHLLLDQKSVREAPVDTMSLYGRIKVFANHRIAALSKPNGSTN